MLTVDAEAPMAVAPPAVVISPSRTVPRFSLVLATYGRSDVLGPMLDSLARQTLRDFELVVVDQNPDDRVVPMLEPIRQTGIPVVHLKVGAPNLSASRNRGIEAARGAWVAFPDDDCWYEAGCLAAVADAIEGDPRVDGWVADWVEANEADGAAALPAFDATVFRAFRGGDASSITLFLRTAVVRREAGFDERIGVGRFYGAGEETDLMIRLLDSGAAVRRLPEARVHHHYSRERPVLSRQTVAAHRRRERGVGALYAKHRLSPLIIGRGLFAPLTRALAGPRRGQRLVFAGATVAGRISGMVRWLIHERRAPEPAPLVALADRAEPSEQSGIPARPRAGQDRQSEGVFKMSNTERKGGR